MNQWLKRLCALMMAAMLLTMAQLPAQARSKKKRTATPTVVSTATPQALPETAAPDEDAIVVERDGEYTDKEHVAAYLREFHELPSNYITKRQAQDLGWVSNQGNLWIVAPGKSIGGDRFGNYEGLLPDAEGRKWYECDIDFDGRYRNAKRILFSNDGLIYYTEDHYQSFVELKTPENRAGP